MTLEAIHEAGYTPGTMRDLPLLGQEDSPSSLAESDPHQIWIKSHLDEQGVTHIRIVEADPYATMCVPDLPITGERLLAPWTQGGHVLLWTEGHGEAVMLQTNDLGQIKPLAQVDRILSSSIPEEIRPTDIFPHPEDPKLIHIGISANEEDIVPEIQKRTGVDQVIHIQPNQIVPPDEFWDWGRFAVAYDWKASMVRIFPVNGNNCISIHIGNSTIQEVPLPLSIRYEEYVRNGGVFGWHFMRDAYTLTTDQMQKRYPRSRLYLGTVEDYTDQVKQLSKKSGIQFTEEQEKIYVDLRFVPIEHHQAFYVYGPQPPESKNGTVPFLRHPGEFWEIGLMGEVLKFTGDNKRLAALNRYIDRKEMLRAMYS